MPSQIEARPKPEDPALRTNAPLPDHGQPPKLILQEDGGVDLPSLMSLQKAFGTSDQGLTEKLLLEAVGAIPDLKSLNVNQINPVIAAIHAIAPRDALEGMLAVQMISVHNVAMERLRRSIGADSLGEDSSINEATKLLKLFTTLMEALDRRRGKGDSKMVVKHLHVEKGAQAIVGPVSHPSPGNPAEDSHGKLQ
jgi:hypothetical protein